MNLDLRRVLRPPLAAAGIVAALLAAGCGITIEEQSAEQLDQIGDVAITTQQCVDGWIYPEGLPIFLSAGQTRGEQRGSADGCDDEPDEPELTRAQRSALEKAAARGFSIGSGYNLEQLLLAYEVPNGAEAPSSFAFAEKRDEAPPTPPALLRAARGETEDPPQSGEYRLSSSYASELEELYPTGSDTKWAAYASTPVRAYWGRAPRWSSTARFGLAGADLSQPFRGPFAFGTVVGSRTLGDEEDANAPVDCQENAHCDDDTDGLDNEDERVTRAGARKLGSSAIEVSTRDLAVAPKGDEVNIPAGQSGEIPFELRYAGKALSGVSFALKGSASLAGATVTAVPDTFAPADDQTQTVKLNVAVPAGTPVGPQNVELVATLPSGQKRSGGTQFNVLAANAVPSQEIVTAPSRSCVSRRSFTIRLRSNKRDPLVSAVVTVNGKKVQTVKKGRITAPVRLAGLPKGRFTVKITAKTRSGKTRTGTRKYRTCTPKRKGGTPEL